MTDYKIIVLEVACGGLWAETLLNGAPVVRVVDGARKMIQAKGNPWVVEGPNWLQARLGFPQGQDSVGAGAEFRLLAFEIEHGDPAAVRDVLTSYEWDAEDQPIEEPGLQLVLERQIAPTQTHGRWAWEDAAPYRDGDRPAVEALVQQVHQALSNRDLATMQGLMALKHEELARGLDVSAAELEQDSAEGLQTAFTEDDWLVAPLDPTLLVLEPTAGGRLVNVYGPQMSAPVRASVFQEALDVKMTVSHLAQGWTIVR